MGQIQQYQDPTGKMSDLEVLAQTVASLVDEFNRTQDTRTGNFQQSSQSLIINDGSTNRICIGLLPDNTWGIVVVAPGVDISQVFS